MRWIPIVLTLLAACAAPAAECDEQQVFPGDSPEFARWEYRGAETRIPAVPVLVPLLPEDAGLHLRVYPTTDGDVWLDGGSLAFLDAGGEVLREHLDLRACEFQRSAHPVPEGAASASLVLPSAIYARLLFTVALAAPPRYIGAASARSAPS